jgi:cytochrome c-type biogenesis protein CcmH/NrfG
VARGTQHRKRRPAQNARAQAVTAAPPRRQKPPQWQEELFFQRLRNHAKGIFVLLAIVFALSFVFLGVGSGSTGITDALQNAFSFGSTGGGTSISKLQSDTVKHPQSATAWRNLATAFEQKQKTQQAVDALQRYIALRPKDQSALAEVAAQYATLATTYSNDYATAQQQMAEEESPAAEFAPPSTTPFGKAFADPTALKDPISAAVATLAATTQQTAYSNYQNAQLNAEGAYKKLVALNPSDATSQVQLGQAAQAAQDVPTAIAAFKAFLKLAPTDPLTPQVKSALKTLEAQAAAATATATGG